MKKIVFVILSLFIQISIQAQIVKIEKLNYGVTEPAFASMSFDSLVYINDQKAMLFAGNDTIAVDSVSNISFDTFPSAYSSTLPEYFIGFSTWPFGKLKALCFTWDDGFEQQVDVLSKVFDQYDYKTTFAVPTKKISRSALTLYQNAINNGHEIASHTVNHVALTTIPLDSARYEIEQSAVDIENNLGYKPVTFCHPNRKFNTSIDSIVLNSFYTSRFSSILQYPKRVVHTVLSTDSLNTLLSELNTLMAGNNEWILYSGHGLSSENLTRQGVYQPIDSVEFDNYLNHVKTNLDDSVLVDTYDNIVAAQLLRENVILEYADNIIHLNTQQVDSFLNTYSRPNAYITVELDSNQIDVYPTMNVIDKRILNGKLCVTVDLRKGCYIILK